MVMLLFGGTLSAQAQICGDGSIDASESCDDGDTSTGDGCSAGCEVETCWRCRGEPSTCSPKAATVSTIDSYPAGGALVGKNTSIAIGSDGRAVIAYQDVVTYALKVAHCNDDACTSATVSIVDDENDVGYTTSIAIGSDGMPWWPTVKAL